MAVLDLTRADRFGATAQQGSFVRNAFAAVINWREAAKTRKVLSKLSDRELDDIGLTRGDIARL